MTEATLTVKDQAEALAIFGPQDSYLKKVRKRTGTKIVLRGNVISISGELDNVDECLEIINLWKSTYRLKGDLLESDVVSSLSDFSESTDPAMPVSESMSALAELSDLAEPRDRDIRAARVGKEKVSTIQPRTEGQAGYMKAMKDHPLVFCDGPAGCGKTYLAVAQALAALHSEEVRKIVLVRPAVEAGEKLGFLPGDMIAKVNPFVRPLLDAINDMLDFDQVRRYMANDVIEIAPLAFMRGRTLNDTFMILDEAQNTTVTQMKMFLTRMGVNSRIVVTGDATQNDLPNGTKNGLEDGIRRLSKVKGVAIVNLTGKDIVRHRLVREIVSAYETTD